MTSIARWTRRLCAVAVVAACAALSARAAPSPATRAAEPPALAELRPRPDALVKPEWLAGRPGATVFHVSWGGAGEYRRAHVPGAVHFDTNRIERPPLWKLVPDVELERVLLEHGVTRTTEVVLYGEPAMGATRVAFALLYAGVENVRVLDGGLAAWRASGRPVESGDNRPTPAASFGGPFPGRPDLVVNTGQVRALLGGPEAVVVSIRSLGEQTGKTSGYRDLNARGRIRGDVWGGGGSDANHLEDFQNADGTFRSPSAVAQRWAESGIVPDKRVVFYCGTGWRASLAFWDAWVLGWPRIGVYDPGWSEWSRDRNNPTATGPLTGKP